MEFNVLINLKQRAMRSSVSGLIARGVWFANARRIRSATDSVNAVTFALAAATSGHS